MSYFLDIPEKLDKIFGKLAKKDRIQMEILKAKIEQIIEEPHKFKPLRGDMKGARRVHIGKSFVLVYEIDEQSHAIRLLEYEHHDKVYE
jgi:YafQ family addiction module toxin component